MDTGLSNLGIGSGEIILEFSYLLAAIFFVIGLKRLSNPDTARNGNLWAAGGMLLAIITTLVFHKDSVGQGIQAGNFVIISLPSSVTTISSSMRTPLKPSPA